MSKPQMMLVPTPDVQRPRLLIIGCYLSGGRLFRCTACGQEVWSNFGHARRHDESHERRTRQFTAEQIRRSARHAKRPRCQ